MVSRVSCRSWGEVTVTSSGRSCDIRNSPMLLLYSVSRAKGEEIERASSDERYRSGSTVKAAGCESGSLQQQGCSAAWMEAGGGKGQEWRCWSALIAQRKGGSVQAGLELTKLAQVRPVEGGQGPALRDVVAPAAAKQVAHEVTKRDSLRASHVRHVEHSVQGKMNFQRARVLKNKESDNQNRSRRRTSHLAAAETEERPALDWRERLREVGDEHHHDIFDVLVAQALDRTNRLCTEKTKGRYCQQNDLAGAHGDQALPCSRFRARK